MTKSRRVWTPEMRAQQSERMNRIYAERPELRAQIADGVALAHREGRVRSPRPRPWTPAARKRQSMRLKRIYADRPELRAQIAESVAKTHREGRLQCPSGYSWSPEARMRASKRMRAKSLLPKTRAQYASDRKKKIEQRHSRAQSKTISGG